MIVTRVFSSCIIVCVPAARAFRLFFHSSRKVLEHARRLEGIAVGFVYVVFLSITLLARVYVN
jgi:hypothetical protein